MDKDVNQKKGNKQPKIKKKQPLKVVYITNPIKFKTSASEFRSLVQELTGQDSDLPESSSKFAADGFADGSGGGQPEKAEAANTVLEESRNTVHAVLEDTRKIGQHNGTIHGAVSQVSDPASFWSFGGVPKGLDSSSFVSFVDEMYSPQLVEEFQGIVDSNLSQESPHFDVFKRLDSE
ncbi:uncharacterized protein LOC142552058 [Primulina tabacum]|uniref:uncharacterized protein LOC142552058 n=1 Tax=Primulina tabacum TaxID=48773 RepID=UPI003F593AE5